MAATAQINARIDASLKEAGDAALANAGFTPTQAIRAVWAMARKYASRPTELRERLLPDEAEQKRKEEEVERARLIKLAEEGPNIMKNAYMSLGLPWPPPESDLPYEELKELAYAEKYGNDGIF